MIRSLLLQVCLLSWIGFLIQYPTPAYAQDYLANVREFRTAEGLSNDQVLSLLQDQEGFIWIGTKYGLNRFDGHTFRVFTKESHGLQSSVINQLLEGPDGRIWVIRSQETYGKYTYYSIDLLDPAGETVVPWQSAFPTRPFALEQVERIFGTPGGILFKVAQQGYYLLDQQAFQQLDLPTDFRFIAAPEAGHFFGQRGPHYLTLGPEGEVIRRIPRPDSLTITHLVADREGNYWCLAGQKLTTNITLLRSLLKIDPAGQIEEVDQLDQTDNAVLFTAFRQGRSLLYIHAGEIREYECATGKVWTQQAALAERSIVFPGVAFTDQGDGLWIGDYRGLRLFDLSLSQFTTYLQDQPEQTSTRGMTVRGEELIYTHPEPPRAINPRTNRSRAIEANNALMRSPSPFSVQRTTDDYLVFGGKQLIEVDEQYKLRRVSDLSALGDNRIWSFAQDRAGNYWTGFGLEEIVVLSPALDTFQLAPHNGNEDVGKAIKWHFHEDGDYFWVAAQNGLYLVHKTDGVLTQFGANAAEDYYLPALVFHFTHQDARGNYWLATGDGGLIRLSYNPRDPTSLSYRQYKKQDGLPSLELYAILEDERGNLWISTANGLAQFDPNTEEFTVYHEEQGIAHDEFNRLSYYQNTDGRLFFGGLNGITALDPRDFAAAPPYTAPLRLAAASLLSDGSDSLKNIRAEVLSKDQLLLEPEDNFLNLEFSLQDYFYSARTRYNYRILGLREQWTPLTDNTLQLVGLPYGRYTLEVRARGRMNRLSSATLQLTLQVVRPFYLRWWFVSLLLLTMVISGWRYTRWRKNTLLRRQAALEQLVVERTKKIQEDKQLIEEQARQLRELDELKSRFFENVSHELRTPLTLILGPLERVLKRNKLENQDFTLLLLMKENAKRLHKRINEILDLSRIDAVQMTVQAEPVELYPFVKMILAQFEASAQLRGVALQWEYQLERELRVRLDPDKVEKILYNLLANAIKFTPQEGQVSLTCARARGQLLFSIRDNGIGIPEAELPRIFDRFHRVKTDEYYEGTGIGLALCQELAKLMEGEITVRSTEGEGSVFTLQLPLLETFAVTPEHRPAETTADIAELSATTTDISGDPILVVEDNPSLREYLRLILADFHVKTAKHGQEALDLLAEGFRPALIVTDVMMPVMDGMQLLQAIREHDAYRSLPVIMLTAKADSADKVKALRIGVDDYLTKPFVEEELLARIQALIRNSRQRMALQPHTPGAPSPTSVPPSVSAADLQWLETVEGLIMDHIGDLTFGIDQLAEQLEMSTRRVQQKIKALTGMTPKKYQREIQLEYARRLLERGTFKSVTDLSHQIGFSDAHYFSKLYEKRFGKRPSDY